MAQADNLQAAVLLARSGERGRARELFLAIVRQDPGNFRAWLWLSELADTPLEQAAALEQALAHCQEGPEIRRNLQARLEQLQSASAEAAPPCLIPQHAPEPVPTEEAADRTSTATGSGNRRVRLFSQARQLASAGKLEEAARLLHGYLKAFPRDIAAWLLLSELLKDPEEAFLALQKVVALEPGHPEAAQRLYDLRPRLPDPLRIGRMLEEDAAYAEAIQLYQAVIVHSRKPTDRLEANLRIANIQMRQEADRVQPISPTLNLLRVAFGPVLLFALMVFIQSGLSPLHISLLAIPGMLCVMAGSLLVSVTGMRPMHPKWIERYGRPGTGNELEARLDLRRLGWLLMLAPFTIFLIEAAFRLGDLQASMMGKIP